MPSATKKKKAGGRHGGMSRQNAGARSGKIFTIILSILLMVGIVLLTYPFAADRWNSTRQTRVIDQYMAELNEIDQGDAEAIIAAAQEYNYNLAEQGFGGQLDGERENLYQQQLSYNGSDVMGYVEINKIDVRLPIYHGTEESELTRGIGHLAGTSLPVGAKSYDDETSRVRDPKDGSHCVISGHRGLPSSKLFTDLDRLEIGDSFALNCFGKILIYEVDQINIVEPSDLSLLKLEKGKDYCTLVTCTPYGINSHRLLIRGIRVSTEDVSRYIYRIQQNATQILPAVIAVILAAPILALLFAWAMISPSGRKRKRNNIDEELMEEFEVADLPLTRLDLSVQEINRMMEGLRSANKDAKASAETAEQAESESTAERRKRGKRK